MKPSGEIYNLKNLLSKEERREHRNCKPGVESKTKFDELIDGKTKKLIEDLESTNYWKVEEANDDFITKYFIKVAGNICTGRNRRGVNIICKHPFNGYIFAFDKELQEFFKKYK